MANGFITYWGNLIPSEFTLRVAKESPGPLRRQSKPAGLAVQADSSRQEPVLLSSVSSKAVSYHRHTSRTLGAGEKDLQGQQTVSQARSDYQRTPEGLPTAPPSKGKKNLKVFGLLLLGWWPLNYYSHSLLSPSVHHEELWAFLSTTSANGKGEDSVGSL